MPNDKQNLPNYRFNPPIYPINPPTPNSHFERIKNLLKHPLFTAIVGALVGGAVGITLNLNIGNNWRGCFFVKECTIAFTNAETGEKVELQPDSFSLKQKSSTSFQIQLSPKAILALAPIIGPDQIFLSAPIIEPAKPPSHFVKELERQKIVYADIDDQIPQVKKWLENPYSGYPALVETLKQILANRSGIGNPVPLTIIQYEYTGGEPNPPKVYDQEKLKQAYLSAWNQKNSGSSLRKFDEIAPLNK
jgi:hypothetical protein